MTNYRLSEVFSRFPVRRAEQTEKRITKCSMCWKDISNTPLRLSLLMRSTTHASTMHIIYPTLTCRRTAKTDQLTHLFSNSPEWFLCATHTNKTYLVVRSLNCSSNKPKIQKKIHLFQAIWSKWNASSSASFIRFTSFLQARSAAVFGGYFPIFRFISRQWGVAFTLQLVCSGVSEVNVILFYTCLLNHLNSSCLN